MSPTTRFPNFLFHNLGAGKFEEVALEAGVALPDHGKGSLRHGRGLPRLRQRRPPDIVFAALAGETFPLFRNEGKGWFRDATYRSRVGAAERSAQRLEPGLFDFNNDGWKDLFFSGAHVNDTVESSRQRSTAFPTRVR